MHRASADVELHSDEESEAPDRPAALSSAAEQQSAGLQIERSSVSEAEMSASSGGSEIPDDGSVGVFCCALAATCSTNVQS